MQKYEEEKCDQKWLKDHCGMFLGLNLLDVPLDVGRYGWYYSRNKRDLLGVHGYCNGRGGESVVKRKGKQKRIRKWRIKFKKGVNEEVMMILTKVMYVIYRYYCGECVYDEYDFELLICVYIVIIMMVWSGWMFFKMMCLILCINIIVIGLYWEE